MLEDFNIPTVNREAVMSSRSDDQQVVDFLTNECELSQIVATPAHKCGNVLDLALFSNIDL